MIKESLVSATNCVLVPHRSEVPPRPEIGDLSGTGVPTSGSGASPPWAILRACAPPCSTSTGPLSSSRSSSWTRRGPARCSCGWLRAAFAVRTGTRCAASTGAPWHRSATRTYTGRPPERTLRIESCSSDRSLRAGGSRRARRPPNRRSRTSNRRRDLHTSRRAASPSSPRRPPPLPSPFESRTLPSAVRRRVDTVQLDPAEMMPRKATRMPAAKIAAAK
jgi:hypothetical protein